MTNKDDKTNMLPDASPGRVGIRRVNRVPMFIIMALVIAFLLVMIFVASKRANQQNSNTEEAKIAPGNSNAFAYELTNKHQDGIIPSEITPPSESPLPTSTPPLPTDKTTPNPSSSVNISVPPLPDDENESDFSFSKRGGTSNDQEQERIQMSKMQLFEQSIRSKTAIDVVAPASPASSNYSSEDGVKSREEMIAKIAAMRNKVNIQSANGDITEAYRQKLAMVKNAGLVDDNIDDLNNFPDSGTKQNNNFNGQHQGSWQLENKMDIPSSPYLLRTGFVIPATLISGINSELPGQIIAQVSQNVYDTATGKHLLVPQGARLNGFYSSDVVFGQARVMVAWQRIIFPDGKALDIGSMPGADAGGYSGLNDQVNNHYFRIFSSAVLLSGITAGISYSQDHNNRNSNDDKSTSGALSEALGQQLGQTTVQLINKNMNIAPTLEIRPGYRFNVVVTKDIVFTKPYKSFDY